MDTADGIFKVADGILKVTAAVITVWAAKIALKANLAKVGDNSKTRSTQSPSKKCFV